MTIIHGRLQAARERDRYRRASDAQMAHAPTYYQTPEFGRLVSRAHEAFEREYRRSFRPGGDEDDHDEAVRCGLEAALALALEDPEAPRFGSAAAFTFAGRCMMASAGTATACTMLTNRHTGERVQVLRVEGECAVLPSTGRDKVQRWALDALHLDWQWEG